MDFKFDGASGFLITKAMEAIDGGEKNVDINITNNNDIKNTYKDNNGRSRDEASGRYVKDTSPQLPKKQTTAIPIQSSNKAKQAQSNKSNEYTVATDSVDSDGKLYTLVKEIKNIILKPIGVAKDGINGYREKRDTKQDNKHESETLKESQDQGNTLNDILKAVKQGGGRGRGSRLGAMGRVGLVAGVGALASKMLNSKKLLGKIGIPMILASLFSSAGEEIQKIADEQGIDIEEIGIGGKLQGVINMVGNKAVEVTNDLFKLLNIPYKIDPKLFESITSTVKKGINTSLSNLKDNYPKFGGAVTSLFDATDLALGKATGWLTKATEVALDAFRKKSDKEKEYIKAQDTVRNYDTFGSTLTGTSDAEYKQAKAKQIKLAKELVNDEDVKENSPFYKSMKKLIDPISIKKQEAQEARDKYESSNTLSNHLFGNKSKLQLKEMQLEADKKTISFSEAKIVEKKNLSKSEKEQYKESKTRLLDSDIKEKTSEIDRMKLAQSTLKNMVDKGIGNSDEYNKSIEKSIIEEKKLVDELKILTQELKNLDTKINTDSTKSFNNTNTTSSTNNFTGKVDDINKNKINPLTGKEGGTISWRNNNQGNLKYAHNQSADKSDRHMKRGYKGALQSAQKAHKGVIGLDRYGNAVFENEEAGRNAHIKHLSRKKNKTVEQMIKGYAVDDYSGKANHRKYANSVYKTADEKGFNLRGRKLGSFSKEELEVLADGMRKVEGYKKGTNTIQKPKNNQIKTATLVTPKEPIKTTTAVTRKIAQPIQERIVATPKKAPMVRQNNQNKEIVDTVRQEEQKKVVVPTIKDDTGNKLIAEAMANSLKDIPKSIEKGMKSALAQSKTKTDENIIINVINHSTNQINQSGMANT